MLIISDNIPRLTAYLCRCNSTRNFHGIFWYDFTSEANDPVLQHRRSAVEFLGITHPSAYPAAVSIYIVSSAITISARFDRAILRLASTGWLSTARLHAAVCHTVIDRDERVAFARVGHNVQSPRHRRDCRGMTLYERWKLMFLREYANATA